LLFLTRANTVTTDSTSECGVGAEEERPSKTFRGTFPKFPIDLPLQP
jgi:hypothetical protein